MARDIVDENGPDGQEIEALEVEVRDEGELAEIVLARFRDQRLARRVPRPQRLEFLVNRFVIPAWKAVGAIQTLEALQTTRLDVRLLERCENEARDEVVQRGRSVIMLRDMWKENGLPNDGRTLCGQMDASLAPFYRAIGALDLIERLLKITRPF